ncbi:MAG: GtrA family protein [Chloroflexi bacterium]|nr:GtrA family protein [Chloroflexota bacterium]
MILNNSKERQRFLRFAMVGVIGAVVDFGILNLLLHFSTPYVLAAGISFALSALNNFLWNRYWTYPDSRSKNVSKQLLQFGIINLIGLAIRVLLLGLLENTLIDLAGRLFPDFFVTPQFIGHNAGVAIAILIVMLWNFLANRYWTYNDVSN